MKTTKAQHPYVDGGSVSWGTTRAQDIVPRFMNALSDIAQAKGEHWQLALTWKNVLCNVDKVPDHAWDNDDCDWWESDYCEYLIEGLIEALEECAPTGFYFAAHDGDGTDYGYWELEGL